MDPSGFLGATVIDVDVGGSGPSNVPGWISEVLERALGATGIRSKRKVASEEAIASLQDVDLSTLESQDCPICYDRYDTEVSNDSGLDKQESASSEALKANEQLSTYIREINAKYHIPLEPPEEAARVRDPSLFFPLDQGGTVYSRFPQRNIHNLEVPNREDVLPGYEEISQRDSKKRSLKGDASKNSPHLPVKMPNCDHVFGKSCIIEWLKDNVSCPLCRKEVEELKEKDPREKRLEYLERFVTDAYSPRDHTLDHILNESTDIFNPFRRPFNPTITPLTDTNLVQSLATPTFSLGASYDPVDTPEPHLVLPGKLPVSAMAIGSRSFHFSRRNRPTRRRESNSDSEEGTPRPFLFEPRRRARE